MYIYRHPVNIVNQLKLFSRTIEEKFCNLSNNKSVFYILGDFNIDLLQVTNNRVIKNYAENLVGYSIKCTINKPTRIFNNSKKLLDHIYTNCCHSSAISGIALSDISDHFPSFMYLPDRKIKKKLTETFYIRDTSNFYFDAFCENLNANLNNLLISETRSRMRNLKSLSNRLLI